MKEEFKADAWNDFRQRYQNTYGWFQGSEKEILVQLEEVNQDQLRFVDKNDTSYFAHPDKGNVFSFLPIEKGVYNYENDVVFCTRVPARQWRRGICSQNTQIRSLVTGVALRISFDVLETIFTKDKTKSEEAVNIWREGKRHAVALNNLFGVVGKNLFLFNNNIGTYTNDRFLLHSNLFQQEVNDMIQQLQLKAIVDVKK